MSKTIFNTTEKSNFILNMTTEAYHGYLLRILLGYAVLITLFSIPLEFAALYTMPGMALSIIGVLAMVFVLIGFMKKVTPAPLQLPAWLWLLMTAWGVACLSTSYVPALALMGGDGRNEGLLSIVFYGCIFLLGAQLGTEENRSKLLYGLLGMGLVNCVWGLLQAFGFPSYYDRLDPLLMFDANLPSGLAGSPIFLAILLVMLLPAAMLGAACADSKKQRIFCTICAVVYALMAVRSQTLLGVCGTGAALLVCGIYAAVKQRKTLLPRIVASLAAAVLGIVWVCVSPAINGTNVTSEHVPVENGFHLYDGAIMWTDAAYRLNAGGYYTTADQANGTFDIESIPDTYGYLWSRTCAIIKGLPVSGTGMDNMAYPQIYKKGEDITLNLNAFDRCYNYYLQIAATMGIPGLLLFLSIAAIVVIGAIRQLRWGGWSGAAVGLGAILYLLVMVIGTSAVTVTPVFWMLAGACLLPVKKQKS